MCCKRSKHCTRKAGWRTLCKQSGLLAPSSVVLTASAAILDLYSRYPPQNSIMEFMRPLPIGSRDASHQESGAVARIYRPGAKADCCLILEGPQGIKKSTALRTLAGEYFTDELADLGSKDAALQIRGVWIVEISELDSLVRSEIASIKAFMSRSADRSVLLRKTSRRMPAAMRVCRHGEPHRVSAR